MAEQMTANGAQVLMPPTGMFRGERFARVRDPFGHEWGVTTKLREMTPEEIQASAATMFEEMTG
jgi:PhnB protein